MSKNGTKFVFEIIFMCLMLCGLYFMTYTIAKNVCSKYFYHKQLHESFKKQKLGQGILVNGKFYTDEIIGNELAKWEKINDLSKKPNEGDRYLDGITVDGDFYSNADISAEIARLNAIKKYNEMNTQRQKDIYK